MKKPTMKNVMVYMLTHDICISLSTIVLLGMIIVNFGFMLYKWFCNDLTSELFKQYGLTGLLSLCLLFLMYFMIKLKLVVLYEKKIKSMSRK